MQRVSIVQEKQSMCTREELEREEGVTRIFRTLPSHVGVHTNPWYCKQVAKKRKLLEYNFIGLG